MTATLNLPGDLREQMIERLRHAPEGDLVIVQEALRHAEKLRLLDAVSEDADRERDAGKWSNLPELIQEVRARLRKP